MSNSNQKQQQEFASLEAELRRTRPVTQRMSPATKRRLRAQLIENTQMKQHKTTFPTMGRLMSRATALSLVLGLPLLFWSVMASLNSSPTVADQPLFEESIPVPIEAPSVINDLPTPTPTAVSTVNVTSGLASDSAEASSASGDSPFPTPTIVSIVNVTSGLVPVDLLFGEQLRLSSIDLQQGQIDLLWEPVSTVESDYMTFVHILDQNGNLIGQQDSLLFSHATSIEPWSVGEQMRDTKLIEIPPEAVSVQVGVYDATTFSRLVLADGGSAWEVMLDHTPLTLPDTVSLLSTALGGRSQTLTHADLMADAGMTWVKFQYKWTPGDDPNAASDLIQLGHDRGFKVLLEVVSEETYPNQIDFAAYVAFLAGIASLPDPPDAIELWSEMNIDYAWPAGEIDPAVYVDRILAPAYTQIKEINSNILVISGAPAPTGYDMPDQAWLDDRYIEGMAAAGAINYLDCIGVTYNAGATSPRETNGHPAGLHHSWYYPTMVDTYSNAFDNAAPLCFTEIGYLSSEGLSPLAMNFDWASDNSVDDQAEWLATAFDMASSDDRVSMMIVFNVDFTSYQGDAPLAGYALVRPDGSCPACEALQDIHQE